MGGGMGGGGGTQGIPGSSSMLGQLAQQANPQAKDPMQNLGNRGFPNIPKGGNRDIASQFREGMQTTRANPGSNYAGNPLAQLLGGMRGFPQNGLDMMRPMGPTRPGESVGGKTAMNPDAGTGRPGGEPGIGGGRVTAPVGEPTPMGGSSMDRVPGGEVRPSPRPTIRPTTLPEGGQQQKFQFQQLGYNRPTPRPGSAQPILGAGPGGMGGGAKPPAQPGGGPPRFSDFWNQDSWNQNQGTNFKPGEDRQGARRLARQEAIDSWRAAGGSGQLYPGSPPGGPSARKPPMAKPGVPLRAEPGESMAPTSGAGK